ncbi:MAG: hypothetical protein NTW87_33620 [Planctomycetota bacterium]|nr:hypothetical protein [Planctomycetota bacterium]
MTNRERQPDHERRNHDDDHTRDSEAPLVPEAPAAAPIRAAPGGPRVWVLPAAAGEWWPVIEEDAAAWADALPAGTPLVLSAASGEDVAKKVRQRGHRCVMRALDRRVRQSLVALVSRALLAAAWMLAALLGLLLAGWPNEYVLLLLILGGAFLAYSVVRHGRAVVRWHNRRVDASHALTRATVVPSPLVERLARALHLRRTLPSSERGKSPDDELLDASAHRKLIKDGVTTEADLSALGKAIAAALKLDPSSRRTQRLSDLARKAGLDMESAIFYRDLVSAAAEIELEQELPE